MQSWEKSIGKCDGQMKVHDYDAETKEILVLNRYLDALSKGIDPTCRIEFSEDTILNSTRIQNTLQRSACMLMHYYDMINYHQLKEHGKRMKIGFFINEEIAQTIQLSKEPLSIVQFVTLINSKHHMSQMKPLRTTDITTWLLDSGYLETIKLRNNVANRIPTSKGKEIGLFTQERQNANGELYYTCYYPLQAQQYILAHLVQTNE